MLAPTKPCPRSDDAVPELDDISCMTHSESESTFFSDSSSHFHDEDISIMTPSTCKEQVQMDDSKRVFLGTFRKNLETLGSIVARERLSPEEESDEESTNSNSSPLSTFTRNMSTIGGTFTRNLSFASKQAESIVKDLRTLRTLSKTVDYFQEQTHTMSQDIGNLETFSKNVDFAQATAQSFTEDIASSAGGTALRSCLKKGKEESSRMLRRVSWTDGYNRDSHYLGIGIKSKPMRKKSKQPQFADPMPVTAWSQPSIRFENMDLVKGSPLVCTIPVVDPNLEKAKLAYERQALEADRRWRALLQETQRRQQTPTA